MGYLGNPPTSAAFVTDTFNGTGSQTAYTMSVAPASTSSMLVVVGGVLQDPSTYAIVGMTLNFSSAPPSGTGNISVRYMGIPASGVTNTAYRTVTDFTATAGQTTWTVPSYTVGFIDVFRNGARLGAADFTATNGTSITLALAANANDLITTVSFSVSSVLNAIPNVPRGVTTANMPVGSVLQVVQQSFTSNFSTTANGLVNTQVAASITPSSATSKILVVVSPMIWITGTTVDAGTGFGILRGSTNIYSTSYIAMYSGSGASTNSGTLPCITYLDSPATTAATVYTLQVNRYTNNGGTTVQVNRNYNGTDISTITLMEIAA